MTRGQMAASWRGLSADSVRRRVTLVQRGSATCRSCAAATYLIIRQARRAQFRCDGNVSVSGRWAS